MKVHLFKVESTEGSVPLEEVLTSVEQTSLRQRLRLVGQREVRVEDISHNNGIWLLDFIMIRTDHGPGKVGRDTPVEGFVFDENEGFGEETAILYDSNTGYLVAQYNHFGVRPGSIQDYLSGFNIGLNQNNIYTFIPKLDQEIERKLEAQGLKQKLAFSIDMTRMNAVDRVRGTALSQAINFGRGSGADKIKIEIAITGDRSRGLFRSATETIVEIQQIINDAPDAVTKLEVTGRENENTSAEILNLLGHKITLTFSDIAVGPDLRYPRQARMNALRRAHNGWRRLLT